MPPHEAGPPNFAGSRRATATILVISPNEEDQEFFSSIFQLPYWKAYRVPTYHEALKWLTRDRMSVIICDCRLPDGDWKDILSETQMLPDPPCVIVTSCLPDDLLWAEVLNLGGYDLVTKPFVREEAVRVAELAAWSVRGGAANQDHLAEPRKAPQRETSSAGRKPRTAAAAG